MEVFHKLQKQSVFKIEWILRLRLFYVKKLGNSLINHMR